MSNLSQAEIQKLQSEIQEIEKLLQTIQKEAANAQKRLNSVNNIPRLYPNNYSSFNENMRIGLNNNS